MPISQQWAHMHFQSQHRSRVVRTASTSLPVEFSHSSGLAARQSNGIPLFPSHVCVHIHSHSRVMSTTINITADAAVLTTGVERRGYPIFLNQLHYFIYNVEDRDNSKYCNNDAKDKAPIWTKRRGQMNERPRKEELNTGERIVSEHMQMPMRKRITIWKRRESNGLTEGVNRTKTHTGKIPPSPSSPSTHSAQMNLVR